MNNLIQIFRLEEKLETIDLEEIYFSHRKQDDVSSHQKILDYLQLEKTRQDIGEKGEQYVYEREKRRLLKSNSRLVNDVSREPAKDPKNGYDILSFTDSGEKIYIEVKSTKGNVNEPFYMTANEREKANQVNKNGGIYRPYPAGGVDKLIDFESNINDATNPLILTNAVDEDTNPIATVIGNLTVNNSKFQMSHAALTVDGDFTAQNSAKNIDIAKDFDITGDLNLTKVEGKVELYKDKELTVGGDINVTSVTNGVYFWYKSVVNALNLNVAAGNTVTFHKNQETFLGEGVATAGVLTNNGTVDIVPAVSGSEVPAKVWCNTRAGNGTYPNGKPQYYSE